jgi:hypothetical protein
MSMDTIPIKTNARETDPNSEGDKYRVNMGMSMIPIKALNHLGTP